MAAQHLGEFEVIDYSNSRSSVDFYFGAITVGSLPGFLTQFGALRTALGNIILGTVSRERWIGDSNVLSNLPPVNSQATRLLKWHVHYVDTFKAYDHDLEIATPDVSLLSPDFEDHIDYSDPAVQAFITAFEDIVRVPIAGGEYPVVIEHIYLVGSPKGWKK